jgi:predicted nuclease with TOPRIM domain
MLTQHTYQKLEDTWESKVKECCDMEDPDDPRGCDCCYDTWQDELKVVKTKYSESEEKAKQLKGELTIIVERRDRLKNWYDELTKANDLARKLCDQLELFLAQAEKVSTNTDLAVKAIKTLYCMIRDFYMQVDLIKTKYDRLQNCIKCLNNPALAPGVGIVKCLDEYGK